MAITNTAVWEVQTIGSDTSNAGAFNPSRAGAGTDYSLLSPLAFSDLAVDATTNTQVTSASIGFTSALIGNHLRIVSGTGFTTGVYEITAVSAGKATLDRSPAAAGSAGGTGRLGGPMATPGQTLASGFAVASNKMFIKSGTYTFSASSNVSGGFCTLPGGSSAAQFIVCGYDTNRTLANTDANRPIIEAGAASVKLFVTNGYWTGWANLDLRNTAGYSNCVGIENGWGESFYERIKATGLNYGFNFGWGPNFGSNLETVNCSLYHYQLGSSASGLFDGIVARGGGGRGFYSQGPLILNRAVITGVTDYGVIASARTKLSHVVVNSVTGTGIGYDVGGDHVDLVNCVASNCLGTGTSAGAGKGFVLEGSGRYSVRLRRCFGFNNGANYNTTWLTDTIQGFVPLTENPYMDAAALDFRPNTLAGGGALLRANGYPATLPGLTGANAVDAGAYQHADSVSQATPFAY